MVELPVSLLPVASNGTIADQPLQFRSARFISSDCSSVLEMPSAASGATTPPKPGSGFVAPRDISGEELIGWDISPDRAMGVLRAVDHAIFFSLLRSAQLRVNPVRTTNVVFARGNRKIAAVERKNESNRVVVFDFDGAYLHQGQWTTDADPYSLYIVPSGQALLYLRRLPHTSRDEAVGLNVANGTTRVLNAIPDGWWFPSEKGDRMLVVAKRERKACYFDVSNPFQPSLLWEYDTEHLIRRAAISGDGSLIALGISTVDDSPPVRIVVLDAAMTELADPLLETDIRGLQFSADFLFVGFQRKRYPGSGHLASTTRVLLYDLENHEDTQQ